MTDASNETTLIVPLHEIHHNHANEFVTNEHIDPLTGQFGFSAKQFKLAPNRVHEVPAALAAELFAMAAQQSYPCVREPEEREIESYRQSQGIFNKPA